MAAHGVPMTDSSDDSADTVISVLDSRLLSQTLSNSDSPINSDVTQELPDSDKPTESNVMGNLHGGDKKKKKEEDVTQEKKAEDKPKKRGKKSKAKSKRNSKNVEGEAVPGEGACSSPSSSTATTRSRAKSKRPDVLADLGQHSPGSPLGSPESASGSQGTWSVDEESDVSTLGYSTPLLSTPQVQRYVLPKQTTTQQSSTERLEELGRSIERTIIDKLSDKPQCEGATAAVAGQVTSAPSLERKERRNVKKKRALGQAVIDSESFTLPLQELKSGQTASSSPTTKRLNVGTDKISLRASQESPVSPWLRDDDTPMDEEQMDEMFISCIDLSYNLADICSEKEFTEYGSLDSKKQSKSAKDRAKDTSLSPRIVRKPILPIVPMLPEVKSADSRETPPKSDSSTSTLAEIGHESLPESIGSDLNVQTASQTVAYQESDKKPAALASENTSFPSKCIAEVVDNADKQQHVKKKSKAKTKKRNSKCSEASKESSDIPTETKSNESSKLDTCLNVSQQKDPNIFDDTMRLGVDVSVEEKSDYDNEPAQNVSDEQDRNTNFEPFKIHGNMTFENSNLTSSERCVKEIDSCGIKGSQDIKHVYHSPDTVREECDMEQETVTCGEAGKEENIHQSNDTDQPTPMEETSEMSEKLSPKEPASPKHVPPPSPLAMDALAEVDEDDEEAIEAMESTSQFNEVQLFGETVLKRLSSLVESQSQDEEIEERFKDFQDERGAMIESDSPPVNLGSMVLLDDTGNTTMQCEGDIPEDKVSSLEVMEEAVVPVSTITVEKSVISGETTEDAFNLSTKEEVKDVGQIENNGDDDEGTLKRKKKKSSQKKSKKDRMKKDTHGNVVKKPEIPAELKQAENIEGMAISLSEERKNENESEKENTPPKRESQQIEEVINAYGISDLNVDKTPGCLEDGDEKRPHSESDSDDEDEDSESSFNSKFLSSGHPSSSSIELTSRYRDIPDIEETFSELLSVKHILEDLEDRTPTEEVLPSFVGYDELRSPPELLNGRRSRMSPAVTDRTESDLDISEQRDDISTDSMYADDEDDGASEVLFSRSYSEPAGNEVVVSCTFYNTQHNNNNIDDSDDFWEDYSTADESFKQIEISADAASSTFQNARKQMHDIHQHLQDLRRQMEHLQEEVESATLTPEYSVDSEDKRHITE